ncbi:hypothetical protein [Streptomyces triculaminicus]|uniref:hypothetical protein n=1 Tax=Streptomyces triculaminicus TaxID=2816232 RepID=UPI0037D4E00C
MSRILYSAGPSSSWSDACPRIRMALHIDSGHALECAVCPEDSAVWTVAAEPLPWARLVRRIPDRGEAGAWEPDDYRLALDAYEVQTKVAWEGLADHLVVLADGKDPRTVVNRIMGRATAASSVCVLGDDGAVLEVGLKTRGDHLTAPYGFTMRVTAMGAPHALTTRVLYGPAMLAWYYQWHAATGQPLLAYLPSLAKLPVPWPALLEIADPHTERSHRIRVEDVTPVRIR